MPKKLDLTFGQHSIGNGEPLRHPILGRDFLSVEIYGAAQRVAQTFRTVCNAGNLKHIAL